MATAPASTIALQSSLGVWAPPPGVTGHTGEPIPPESVFFVPPPPEIGEIRSAYASLKAGAKTRSRGTRIILAVIWSVVPILVAAAIVFLGGATFEQGVSSFGIAVVLGAAAAAIAWNVTRFKHSCEFVGSDGCIVLKCRDAVDNVTVEKSLRFKDAASLSISMTRYYKGGSYRNSMYHFQWFPPQSDQAKFSLLGWIDEKEGTPPAGDAYNLGRAIENAWYAYLLPKLQAELRANGSISFQMDSKRRARLGPGFIEIVEKDGAIHRCAAGDIGSANLASGTFTLTRKDSESRFFGLLAPSGEFQFDYAKMHNGRAFLFAFENLLGIKLG
jgi:hypothetical protein